MTNIYIESIFMAWGSILSNKMRSLLTMLGIIIGVAAVIALMSIGYGVQSDIENNISSLGSNTITVTPGTGRKPGIRPAAGSMQTLTYKDYLAIRNLPNISYAAPLVNTSYLVVNGNKNWTTRIYGCTEDYATLSSLSVSEGRFWTDKEYNTRARVCIIGKTVATSLFGEESPIGQKVRINGNPFTVIGELEEKGYSFMDQDDRVLIPFTTVQERMMHITYVNNIVISSDNADDLSQIESDVTNLLRTRHRIQTGKEDDFSIQNSQDLMETMKSTTQTLTIFLGSIAAISLLVGGIGIMNIMAGVRHGKDQGNRYTKGSGCHIQHDYCTVPYRIGDRQRSRRPDRCSFRYRHIQSHTSRHLPPHPPLGDPHCGFFPFLRFHWPDLWPLSGPESGETEPHRCTPL